MQHERLGTSGLHVSRICLGMMSYGDPASRAWILPEDADFDVVDAVRLVAGERGVPPAQIALAWLLQQPAVTAPIVGATKLSHMEDAVAALDVSLSEQEQVRLTEPYRPHPVRGHS